MMLFWQGERLRGNNLLRRFILAHHRPSVGGQPVAMPLCASSWGGTPARVHLENIRQLLAHQSPMDYYWIDAEWFGKGPWYLNTGDWRTKQDLYPAGFKPISDLLHVSGHKFLLWFEPERVCEGTPWYDQLKDWLLEVPKEKRVDFGYPWVLSQADPEWASNESRRTQLKENDHLFNLGNPEARRFLTDFISGKIDEFGIDCYRHDANIAPLEFWRAADTPDRQGMTEIRWVEGFYAYWDELRRRHPQLIIDTCASGGRRIDIETLSRSLPLWRSDFTETATGRQNHTYGILYWVPLNATSAGDLVKEGRYGLRSSMSSGLDYSLPDTGGDALQKNIVPPSQLGEIKRELEQYRTIQKYFYGDYYPLTEYTQADDAWMAYQLDLPEEGDGLIVVLKRPLSPYTHATFRLHALRDDTSYKLVNLDSNEARTCSGRDLHSPGLDLQLTRNPDSALIVYRRTLNKVK